MTQQLPDWIRAARSKWHYRGQERPPWAQPPSPGQESVWDYPRPPCLMPDHRRVIVCVQGKVLADSSSTLRIVETASPPTFYFPPGDVEVSRLVPTDTSSVCEWKGTAQYWALKGAEKNGEPVAWVYAHPYHEFESIAGYFSFYPGCLECYVGQERVRPQPGGFYGGWVTKEIIGPFKGPSGTAQW
jgi:uncharacterized protein (DUF427 family)